MNEENKELAVIESPFADDSAITAAIIESTDEKVDTMAAGVTDFAKLLKLGSPFEASPWVYGVDKTEILPASVWVLDPTRFYHGWLGWVGDEKGNPVTGQLPDEHFAPWYKAWPERPTDMDHLKEAFKATFVCISSPDEEQVGDIITLSDSKKLGQQTYAEIEMALRKRHLQGETRPELRGEMYAKIMFGYEVVTLKKWGQFHKPLLTIVGWTNPKGVTIQTMAETLDRAEAEANEVEAVPEVVDAEPTPGRRRRRT